MNWQGSNEPGNPHHTAHRILAIFSTTAIQPLASCADIHCQWTHPEPYQLLILTARSRPSQGSVWRTEQPIREKNKKRQFCLSQQKKRVHQQMIKIAIWVQVTKKNNSPWISFSSQKKIKWCVSYVQNEWNLEDGNHETQTLQNFCQRARSNVLLLPLHTHTPVCVQNERYTTTGKWCKLL